MGKKKQDKRQDKRKEWIAGSKKIVLEIDPLTGRAVLTEGYRKILDSDVKTVFQKIWGDLEELTGAGPKGPTLANSDKIFKEK